MAHYYARVDDTIVDDLALTSAKSKSEYMAFVVYALSKLAQVWQMRHYAAKYYGSGRLVR